VNIVLINLAGLAVGYLCGSIMFAVLIARWVTHGEIRAMGNTNPGAANLFESVGKAWGILDVVLDVAKALVPMLVGHYALHLGPITLGLIGIGAMVGHKYPLYFGFRGGRAASTLTGMYIFFIPFELLGSFVLALGVLLLIGKEKRAFWVALVFFLPGALASLFLPHPLEVKIMVLLGAALIVFFNRRRIMTLFKNFGDERPRR
jgi:glycerol-3-phosphate acyltransferase PlsY